MEQLNVPFLPLLAARDGHSKKGESEQHSWLFFLFFLGVNISNKSGNL